MFTAKFGENIHFFVFTWKNMYDIKSWFRNVIVIIFKIIFIYKCIKIIFFKIILILI
jgi:hypothetical protein